MQSEFMIRPAVEGDVPLIKELILELADYERLLSEAVVTEEQICKSLFSDKPCAEAVLAIIDGTPIGFALYFQNFSTFVGKPGIYLEDLYIKPEYRGRGYGKSLLVYLAKLAVQRDCGRLEWSVLDWNTPAINFYRSIHAKSMDEWTVFRLSGDPLRELASQ